MTDRIRQCLGTPVNGASLAVFRIFFGLAVFASVWKYVDPDSSAFMTFYTFPEWNFPYPGLEWVRPVPPAFLKGVFVLLAIACLCLAAGIFYRVSAALMFLCYTYTFLLESSLFNNHFYLISLLSFLLIWMPADRRYSLRNLFRSNATTATVPYWAVLILRLQLFIVYFYGGIAKLNPDFLTGEPIIGSAEIFRELVGGVLPILGEIEAIVYAKAMAWIGLFFDLSIGFLLWIRRTQWLGLGLLFVFHLINHLTLPIGVFPFMGFTASLIFLAPDWPVAAWRWIRSKWKRETPTPPAEGPGTSVSPLPASNAVVCFFAFWMAFQVLLPLRHFFIASDPSWSEEGQDFAWRMMLRQKAGGNLVYHLDDAGIYEPGSSRTKIDWSETPEADCRGVFVGIDASRFSWNENLGLNTLYEGVAGFRIIQAVTATDPDGVKDEIGKLQDWWEEKTGESVEFRESISVREAIENSLRSLQGRDKRETAPVVGKLIEALGLLTEQPIDISSSESRKRLLRANDLLYLAQNMGSSEVVRSELARVHPFALTGVDFDQRFFILAASPQAGEIQRISTQLGRGDHFLIWCDFVRLRNYAWADLPQWFAVFESGELDILWNYFGRLNRRQVEHLIYKPHMIHQYAQRIAGWWEDETGRRPRIYGRGVVMMNYRQPQAIVSSQADLAAEEYKLWRHNDWILPLKGERIGIADRISNR